MAEVAEPVIRDAREWPTDASVIDAARAFLDRTRGSVTAVACDSDVDGLAAAVMVERAVNALGGVAHVLPVDRGEHVHHPNMKRRIEALGPQHLIVLDMGSRPHAILPGIPNAPGHARVTGGSLSASDFRAFIATLGFSSSERQ